MGAIQDFIDGLSKHALLVYFVILWGLSMFLWSVYDLSYYVVNIGDALDVLIILYNLLKFGAGLLLVIFGVKLLSASFLETIDKEKILVYFLLLWAGSLFFSGLFEILWNGEWMFGYFDHMIGVFAGLAELVAGAILGLFGWNLLNEKKPE